MKFSASATLFLATTVAANWSPMHLSKRQSSGGECIDPSDDLCHGSCIPSGYECCPSGGGGCAPGKYCTLGDNGEYGCCRNGKICSGDGGVRTQLGGGGGSDDDFSFSIPSFTIPSFTMPSFTAPSFTGGSGGSGSSGSSDSDGGFSDKSVPTATGSSGGSGGFGSGDLGGGANSDCLSLLSQLPPGPTPAPALQSDLASGNGGGCNYKPPKSLASDWKSYTEAGKSWLSENSAIATKVQSACSSGSTSLPGAFSCKGSGNGAGSLKACMGAVVGVAGAVAVAL